MHVWLWKPIIVKWRIQREKFTICHLWIKILVNGCGCILFPCFCPQFKPTLCAGIHCFAATWTFFCGKFKWRGPNGWEMRNDGNTDERRKMTYLHRIIIHSVFVNGSVGMRFLLLWSLSCVCCTGLHLQGWTGRSPIKQGLAWKRSPLEGRDRNATHSQLEIVHVKLYGIILVQTDNKCIRSTSKSTKYEKI